MVARTRLAPQHFRKIARRLLLSRLLIGAEITNALARASIVRYYRKSISELGLSIESPSRGRTAEYLRLVLALGLILGNVVGAFKLIAWWKP
jgi:hypothetical protein